LDAAQQEERGAAEHHARNGDRIPVVRDTRTHDVRLLSDVNNIAIDASDTSMPVR